MRRKRKKQESQEIDTANTNPTYWEKILERFGLGARQLGLNTDVIETDTAPLEEADGKRPKDDA
jgi:hypothetical protein